MYSTKRLLAKIPFEWPHLLVNCVSCQLPNSQRKYTLLLHKETYIKAVKFSVIFEWTGQLYFI